MSFLPTPLNVSGSFTYSKYTAYSEYQSELAALKTTYPSLFDYHTESNSAVGNHPLYWCTVGDTSKPAIFIEGVLHGRHEWHGAHIILKFLRKLCDPADAQSAFATALLDQYCVIAVPMANPYGYLNVYYTNGHTRVTDPNYPNTEGVNLNRNFDYGWSSLTYDDYYYKGPSALCEPESQLISTLLINKGYTIGAYIALHNQGGDVASSPHDYSGDTNTGCQLLMENVGATRNTEMSTAFTAMLARVEARQSVTITGTKSASSAVRGGMSFAWAQAVRGIPACLFELGVSYSQAFTSDLYLDMLYTYAQVLEPNELVPGRKINDQPVVCTATSGDTAGTQLRIQDAGVKKYIPLVETTAGNASPVRFYDGAQVWALQAGGGGTSVTINGSLDALIQRTGIAQTSTIDALIQKTLSQTLSIDSLVSMFQSGQISIDAFVQITREQTVSIDSLLQAVKSNVISLDAFVQIVGSSGTTLDSLVQATKQGTVTIDSLLFSVFSNQAEIDAFISKTFGNNTSLDAILLGSGTYSSVLLDALLQETKNQTISLDALLKITTVSTTSIDALLQSLKIESVGLDAVILGALSASVSLDSLLQITRGYSVSLDVLLSLVRTGSVSMDAVAMIVMSNSLNLDALLFRSLINAVGLDAIVGGVEEILTYVKRVLTVIYNDRNIIVEAKDRTLTIH